MEYMHETTIALGCDNEIDITLTYTHYPEEKSPRDEYGRQEEPDVPETIDIHTLTLSPTQPTIETWLFDHLTEADIAYYEHEIKHQE